MKLNEILRSELTVYDGVIQNWEEWEEIRSSGIWNTKKVGNGFYMKGAVRISLKGCPMIVDGAFIACQNRLSNLIGGPKFVKGSYDCSQNKLTSLEGVPKVIPGFFDCSSNRLETLHDIHKQINSIYDTFYSSGNPIKSSILGLLMINRLSLSDGLGLPGEIINKHLFTDKDVLECQEELISNGYKEFAKL